MTMILGLLAVAGDWLAGEITVTRRWLIIVGMLVGVMIWAMSHGHARCDSGVCF